MSDLGEQEINFYVLSHGDLELFVTTTNAYLIHTLKRSIGYIQNSWGVYAHNNYGQQK